MIEPISFFAAMRRSWRLIVACSALMAIILVLIPVAPPAQTATQIYHWESWAEVGSPSSNGLIGNTINSNQILFYANSFQVRISAILTSRAEGEFGPLYAGLIPSTSQPAKGQANTTKTTSGKKTSTSSIVYLTALESTKAKAANLANAYAQAVQEKLQVVVDQHASTTKTGGTPTTGFEVLTPASAYSTVHVAGPKASVLVSRKNRLIIGLVLGVLLGILLILARELTDKRIRKPGRAEYNFRAPVIAEVAEFPHRVGERPSVVLAVVDRPESIIAESYRKLRMSIMFEALAPATGVRPGSAEALGMEMSMGPGGSVYEAPDLAHRQVVLVVSPGDEESRSVLVANLAAAYAEAGERALVVNAGDLEPMASGAPVVEEQEVTDEELLAEIRETSIPFVATLSLRPFVANSGQLVTRAETVFRAARDVADVVIVEAPSMMEFHHAEALVHAVDVVVIVSEYMFTTAKGAEISGDKLRRLGAPVLGVAFTKAPLSRKEQRELMPVRDDVSGEEILDDADGADQGDDALQLAGS